MQGGNFNHAFRPS